MLPKCNRLTICGKVLIGCKGSFNIILKIFFNFPKLLAWQLKRKPVAHHKNRTFAPRVRLLGFTWCLLILNNAVIELFRPK